MDLIQIIIDFLAGLLNPLDIAVSAVILLFMILAAKRGLIKSLYKLLSFFISIFLANLLYPVIGRQLRQMESFNGWLTNLLAQSSGTDNFSNELTNAAQNLYISGLTLPDFMKFSLIENNNPEAYGILNATGFSEYIGNFLLNFTTNILAMLLAFAIIYLLMKLLGKLLDVVSMLPVISAFNRFGGLVIGFFQGVFVVWIVFACLSLLLSRPNFAGFLDLLGSSGISAALFENNFITHLVIRVKP